jgi:hypothetical protein
MHVKLQNEAGLMREVKVGFSWTSLLFGGLPFFFRGMPVHGIIWIALSFITCGISNLFLTFMINKTTAQYYLERGYRPAGPGWEIAAIKWGVSTPTAVSA